MKDILIKDTYIPKFLSCSSHVDPSLNYLYHTESPRFVVEVADSYELEELEELRSKKFLFKEVELHDGEKDLLIVVDLIDVDYFQDKDDVQIFDEMMNIMDEMAEWHINEMEDLEQY